MTLRQLLSVLWRRRFIVAVSVVVTLVAAFGYTSLHTATYNASAQVQVQNPSSATPSSSSTVGVGEFSVNPSTVFESPATKQEATTILRRQDPSATSASASGNYNTTDNIITVTATANSAAGASDAANAYAKAFVGEVTAEARSYLASLQTQIGALGNEIAALEKQALAGSPTATAELTSANSALTNLYSEMTTVQAAEATLAQVAIPATAATASRNLSDKKLGAIAVVVGLIAGCGIAFLREQYDQRLRPMDLDGVHDLPVLAVVPVQREEREPRGKKADLIGTYAAGGALVESMRELRTSIRVALGERPSPIIMVTSPAPQDGKTFVVANLAVSWAISGHRVVAMSADLRKPSLERVLGVDVDAPGLKHLVAVGSSEIVRLDTPVDADEETDTAGDESLPSIWHERSMHMNAQLLPTAVPGLFVLPSGKATPYASELLDSSAMGSVLESLRTVADVILIDTPPLVVSDAAILGRQVDGVIVVASEGKTDRNALQRGVDRLTEARAKVLGLVLNRSKEATSAGNQYYYDYHSLPAVPEPRARHRASRGTARGVDRRDEADSAAETTGLLVPANGATGSTPASDTGGSSYWRRAAAQQPTDLVGQPRTNGLNHRPDAEIPVGGDFAEEMQEREQQRT